MVTIAAAPFSYKRAPSHFGTSPVTRRLAQLSTNARSSNICLATILSFMPLEKEFSMVADSTVSSSPAADASMRIKRAARTYGKRRNELEEPTDPTSQHSLRADTIHNTAPPGLQETVPQSSPAKPMTCAIDEFGHGEASDAFREPVFECSSGRTQAEQDSGAHLEQGGYSPKFKYHWRKRLDEIDEELDMEDNNASAEATTNSSGRTQVEQDGGAHLEQGGHSTKFKYDWRKRLEEIDEESDVEDNNASAEAKKNEAPKVSFLFGNARLLQDDTKQLDSATTKSTLPSVADDVFGCPLPSPPVPRAPEFSFELSSPPSAIQRARRRRQRILVQSDSEDEHPKDSSSTAPSTSGRASLESPKSRTSTQPTSDEELPSKVSVEPKKANGSGPVHYSLPPLDVADSSSNVGYKGRRDGKGKSKVIETFKLPSTCVY